MAAATATKTGSTAAAKRTAAKTTATKTSATNTAATKTASHQDGSHQDGSHQDCGDEEGSPQGGDTRAHGSVPLFLHRVPTRLAHAAPQDSRQHPGDRYRRQRLQGHRPRPGRADAGGSRPRRHPVPVFAGPVRRDCHHPRRTAARVGSGLRGVPWNGPQGRRLARPSLSREVPGGPEVPSALLHGAATTSNHDYATRSASPSW